MFRSVKAVARCLSAGRVLAAVTVLLGFGWFASSASAYVYWSTGNFDTIGRANLDGTGVDDSFIKDVVDPQGLALGPNGEYVYWAILGAPHAYGGPYGSIGRANLDGTGVNNSFIKPVIQHAGPYIYNAYELNGGVAADSAHVYWSELSDLPAPKGGYVNGADFARANLDGTGIQDGYGATGPDPTAMAVDSNYIYWVNANNGTIGRSTNLAADVNQNFITGATDATGLALGVNGAYIYWSSSKGTIGRANYNGSGVDADFISGADAPRAVAVNGGYIYWINANGTIGRATVNGTGVDQSFITGATNAGNGLVVNDGPPGTASASPSSVSFVPELVPTGSDSQIVTVTNSGHGVLAVTGTQLTSGDTGDFMIYENTCSGVQLQPGATCLFHVLFQPTAVGTRAATLTVTSIEQTAPLEISLSGDGTAAPNVSSPDDNLAGLKRGAPKLTFRLTAAKGARPLKMISIKLPAGLSFASATSNLADINVNGVRGPSTGFTVTSSTTQMTIKLNTAARRARIAITSPELLEDATLKRMANSESRAFLSVNVVATEVDGMTTQVPLEFFLGKRPKLLG